ncbi:MAG: spherulation-specific family 4 protein [Ilumatobacteraceae bacterium]
MKPMKNIKSRSTIACALLLASAFVVTHRVVWTQAAQPTDIVQKLAVPAYINPLADPDAWSRLDSSTPSSLGFAVVNVINGPDYAPSDEWTNALATAAASGVKLVGYVDTGYLGTTGQRTRLGSTDPIDWMSQIQHDINAWYQFYGSDLKGIFFDQAQNACGPTPGSNNWADLYRTLSDGVERVHPGAITVLNPGANVPQCYENAADVIVTFEGSYNSYIGDPTSTNPYTPLSWAPVDPKKIWHIVYGAPDVAAVNQVIALSKTRSAGYVYVTDDVLANPYDTVPATDYWSAEQGMVGQPPSDARGPARPTGLDTVEVYGTSVDLAWVGSRPRTTPVVAYDIYRDGVLIGSVPGDTVTYTAEDLTPLSQYVFTVVARDALALTSAASNSLAVVTDETYGNPRKPPVGLTAVNTTFTSASLTWAPARQRFIWGRPGIASYVVEQNGREILRLPGSVTGVTVGGLAPGSTYSMSIYSLDDSGDRTGDSDVLAVTTPPLPDGVTIRQTTVTATPDQYTFTGDFLVPFAFRRVFIATGNIANPCWSTGSDPQICADYLVENERLLRYTGSAQRWDWQVVSDIIPTVDGNTYSWVVPAADIGSPANVVAVFNANGYAPNSYCGVGFNCTTTGPPLPYE